MPPNTKRYTVVRGQPYLCNTNTLGFRSDSEFRTMKGRTVKRAILFGDSFSDGHNLSNVCRYSDRISNDGLEIQNYAVGGTGTDQQYLIYQTYCKDTESDLLILAPTDINIVRNMVDRSLVVSRTGHVFGVTKPRFELKENRLHLQERCPHIPVLSSWVYPETAQCGSKSNWLPQYQARSGLGWQLMKSILLRWIEDYAGKTLLLPLPSKPFVYGHTDSSAYTARWLELQKDSDAAMFDPLPRFKDLPDSVMSACFLSDGHYSNYGHHLLSEWIAPEIAKLIEDN